MSSSRPLIAVTMGDPAGVGPEIIAAAWKSDVVHRMCRPLVVGHPSILAKASALRGCGVDVQEIRHPNEASPSPEVMPCLKAVFDEAAQVEPGKASARGGQAAYQAIVAAAKLALAGQVQAMVTAPIHKKALHLAGHCYPGHTELLAQLCRSQDFAMMLYLAPDEIVRARAGLAVVHVTLHMAMHHVFNIIDQESILAKSRLADRFMRAMKGERPRIGVAALNPHAGEEGLFGQEEEDTIRPAVLAARAEGMEIEGPYPADTLMIDARDGRFDAVVAMYHDQGHIALKLLGMHRAVNVTLGLPIVRTSVAHGTAFDKAWQGTANESSMVEAVRVAAVLAAGREGLSS